MLRKPPDILITTPESLYLMLTSRARETLTEVECVILDEIHAVAGSKRGSHLALTLERLEELVRAHRPRASRSSASVFRRPSARSRRSRASWAARAAGGQATAGDDRRGAGEQVARPRGDRAGRRPARSGVRPDGGADGLRAERGDTASRRSIWPSIYPRVLELVEQHSSTIVFVNNRRLAERLALRLNDLAEEEVARSHHGSLSREARTEIEEELKAGKLRCLVATSSLELGIDMGAVDLVIQIESPKSVARGLQRIGRAGHTLPAVSKGRIFPKFRADLVECAVVVKRMREGAIEETAIPRKPLDVLAQHIVAMVALDDWSVDDLHRLVTPRLPVRGPVARRSSRTCSTCSTAATPRRSSPSCGRASRGTASRARCARAAARRSSPSRTRARSPTAACTECTCPTAAGSASWTRRWSTRRAPGRPSGSARRPGASRRSPATA